MLVVMERTATKDQIDAVVARVTELGLTAVPLPSSLAPGARPVISNVSEFRES